jgi:hypothetical protein
MQVSSCAHNNITLVDVVTLVVTHVPWSNSLFEGVTLFEGSSTLFCEGSSTLFVGKQYITIIDKGEQYKSLYHLDTDTDSFFQRQRGPNTTSTRTRLAHNDSRLHCSQHNKRCKRAPVRGGVVRQSNACDPATATWRPTATPPHLTPRGRAGLLHWRGDRNQQARRRRHQRHVQPIAPDYDRLRH